MSLDAETFAIRDQLHALLDDGSPLLLRAPADYGYGPGMWISLGDTEEDPGGRPAWAQARTITAPFQVVSAPAGPNSLVA